MVPVPLITSYMESSGNVLLPNKHSVKAELSFLLEHHSDITRPVIKLIGKDAMERIAKKYLNPIAIPYKVELADFDILRHFYSRICQVYCNNCKKSTSMFWNWILGKILQA